MLKAVNNWKQTGQVFIWRYGPQRKNHAGWHLTAEDDACEGVIALIEAMRAAGQASHRTITLSNPPEAVCAVPNFGAPLKEKLGPLTVHWDPSFSDLTLSEERERLSLRVGDPRADELLRGLRDIRRGEGDYSLAPTEKGAAPPIWFWWMPWSGRR